MQANEIKFKVESKFNPTGDQPQAIEKLAQGLNNGIKHQVLKGVTGSGKTFTMAKVIESVNRPALILAHNKTLAGQLCNEFRELFPNNRVEFFVSYYDYFQPEAYIVQTDTYIEKDLSINDEIDKLRHSATCSLYERHDTIVVASISCIYGLGAPEEYYRLSISLRPNQTLKREDLIKKLVEINYKRNDTEFVRTNFRVKGDVVEIFPAFASEIAIRVVFFGDEIESLSEFEPISGKVISRLNHVAIFPASHYAVAKERAENAISVILKDLDEQVRFFNETGKLIEAQRISQRVRYDVEAIKEFGYCSGIENYSRYFDGREAGTPPFTLLDYFPNDFVLFVDESHISLPQARGMYRGDLARKSNLVNYGFRLPSAYDNRPLTFEEFNNRIGQVIYVSATPSDYELSKSNQKYVEQIIRPTGLIDPYIEVKPIKGQIDDLTEQINNTIKLNNRVLITTLTKKQAESLSKYFLENGIKGRYLHSDIATLERIEIINSLRRGEFDVLVGINLLREGLDIPEVSLVAILDADKEGFLRSTTSLIQTIGRSARNVNGRVIMYADTITQSMKSAIDETFRRREIQQKYNLAHNITPKTIIKPVANSLNITSKEETNININDIPKQIEKLKSLMTISASNLDFEKAILLREQIAELKKIQQKFK